LRHLSARLLSDAVTQEVDFDDEIKLPAGRYQMLSGSLRFTDHLNEEHEMTADFSEDIRKGAFEIKAGEAFTLNPGPPFTIQTEVEKTDDVTTLGINAELVGNEGETYGLRISRDMPKPLVKVLNENGTEIHSRTMEYRRGGVCRNSWRVPADFRGRFRVQIDMEPGPFKIKQEDKWYSVEELMK
jgi:hypothetical protein